MASVEFGWGVLGGEDADAGREEVVERAEEVCGRDGGGEDAGGYLAECVDAGVGAAGALRENAFAGDAVEYVAEGALDGGQAGLDLPAVVWGSVIGEGELPVGHDALDGITRAGHIESDHFKAISGHGRRAAAKRWYTRFIRTSWD